MKLSHIRFMGCHHPLSRHQVDIRSLQCWSREPVPFGYLLDHLDHIVVQCCMMRNETFCCGKGRRGVVLPRLQPYPARVSNTMHIYPAVAAFYSRRFRNALAFKRSSDSFHQRPNLSHLLTHQEPLILPRLSSV